MKVRRKGLFRYSKHTTYFIIIFVISVLVGVGYALLTSTLNINGDSAITRNMWDVHFENIQIKEGSKNDATVEIVNNSTTVNFDINLEEQGEYLDFTVDIVNNGTIDAMLSNITNTGISEASKAYLDYSLTYIDGQEIKENDLLEAGVTERIHVIAKYKDNIDTSLLPEDDVVQEVTLSINYVQSDESAKDPNRIVCKRATTLHSDGTHTFGNETVSIGELTPGDAFDCDVNMDGVYNSETERFYYTTDLDTNSDYAVLIYYNNVSAGEPNATATFAYTSASGNPRVNGPAVAAEQLPTTSQWGNVKLSSSVRTIKDQTDKSYTDFNYGNHAARLLTYQEAVAACGPGTPNAVGYLEVCTYFMENTRYYPSESYNNGYWLENADISNGAYALAIYGGNYRYINYNDSRLSGIRSVRPAIEVPKKNIAK